MQLLTKVRRIIRWIVLLFFGSTILSVFAYKWQRYTFKRTSLECTESYTCYAVRNDYSVQLRVSKCIVTYCL